MSLDEAISLLPEILKELKEQKTMIKQMQDQRSVPTLLTDDQVAEIFGIKKSTLYKWVCAGRITVVKAGGNRFDSKDIERFIESQKRKGRDR